MLVHCQQGVDRSTTVIAAFIMTVWKVKSAIAFRFIQQKRLIANPLDSYLTFLDENESKIHAFLNHADLL